MPSEDMYCRKVISKRGRHVVALLLALPVLAAGGCGGGDSDGEGQQGGPANAKAPEPPALEVVRPGARSSTRSARVTVEGIVAEGATVEVDGKRARIEGPANEESRSRWSAKVPVKRGKNVIAVVATLEGATTRKKLVVLRRAPARKHDSPPDGSRDDGGATADVDPPQGNQGGPEGDQGTGGDGNQGGSGGSGGGQGGGVGGPPEEGNQGGQGGAGGEQGGPQGAPPGANPGDGSDGGQGGPPASPPPPSP